MMQPVAVIVNDLHRLAALNGEVARIKYLVLLQEVVLWRGKVRSRRPTRQNQKQRRQSHHVSIAPSTRRSSFSIAHSSALTERPRRDVDADYDRCCDAAEAKDVRRDSCASGDDPKPNPRSIPRHELDQGRPSTRYP